MATQVPIKKEKGGDIAERSSYPFGMFSDFERWAESFFPEAWMKPLRMESRLLRETMPQVDLIDRKDDILLRAAVPGFSKDNLEVSVTDSTVTLRGWSRKEDEEKKGDGEYYRHEIRTEDFMRTIRLPSPVNDSKAKATFKEGLLELVLPKAESAKRHTLPIE